MVVTHISAQLNSKPSGIRLSSRNSQAASIFIPNSQGGLISAPVTFYVDSEDAPLATVVYQDTTVNVSFVMSVIGYLIPME